MKKFIKKLTKKTEGFTLVELIVVIAILGILAGVAVPAYSGYLTKAKDAADIVTLDAIKTAAQAYKAGANAGAAITELKIEAAGGVISKVNVDGTDVYLSSGTHDNNFMLFLTGNAEETSLASFKLSSPTYAKGADWKAGTWTPGT